MPSGALRIATAVGDFLSAAAGMSDAAAAAKPEVVRALAAGARPGWFKDQTELARHAGVSKGTAWHYSHNNARKPSLSNLARISVSAGLSLSSLFFPELWSEVKLCKRSRHGCQRDTRSRRLSHDWPKIIADAKQRQTAGAPVTAATLARKWGVDPKTLNRRLGSLTTTLNQRHASLGHF